jgi:hypothetical protein
VRLDPPLDQEVATILTGWAERTLRERHVKVEPWLLDEAAQLSRQYLSSLRTPGGVFRMLETAVASVAPAGRHAGRGRAPSRGICSRPSRRSRVCPPTCSTSVGRSTSRRCARGSRSA